MSKAKFEMAKELIGQQRYDEARQVLMTIDHPKSAEWLARLNALEQSRASTSAKRKRSRRTSCLIVAVVLLVVVGVIGVWAAQTSGRIMDTISGSVTAGMREIIRCGTEADTVNEFDTCMGTVQALATTAPTSFGVATGTPIPPTAPAK